VTRENCRAERSGTRGKRKERFEKRDLKREKGNKEETRDARH
jgi:hypothetical protein